MKKILTSLCLVMLLITSTFFAVACNKKDVPVTEVTLDKTVLSLTVGQTGTLVATVSPDNATNKTVSWSSSDENIATVNGGVIETIDVGTAVITASAGGKSAKCSVFVNPVPATTDIGEDDWKNAIQTLSELKNGTIAINTEESGAVYYKGKLLTNDTDISGLGLGMNAQQFLQMSNMTSNPQVARSTSSTVKADIMSGQLSISRAETYMGETKEYQEEYRVENNFFIRLYLTEIIDGITTKTNEVFGSYYNNAISHNILLSLRGLDIVSNNLILGDLTKVKPADAYSNFIPTSATTFYGNFKHNSTVFDDPIDMNVTVRFDENKNIIAITAVTTEDVNYTEADPSIPSEYIEKFKDFTARKTCEYTYFLSNVGSTTVSNKGLEIADESSTTYHPTIPNESSFISLFDDFSLEYGISLKVNDERVSIKKVGDNYYALYDKQNDRGVKHEIDAFKFYITSPNGIEVFNGKIKSTDNGDVFESWDTSTTQPLGVSGDEFASLLKLLPKEVSLYFGTFNNGKSISQLYSEFNYGPQYASKSLTGFGSTLTFDATGEEVTVIIDFSGYKDYNGDAVLSLQGVQFDDAYVSLSFSANDFNRYNPYASVTYEKAIKNALKQSFTISISQNPGANPIPTTTICYNKEQQIVYIDDKINTKTRTVYRVEDKTLTTAVATQDNVQKSSQTFDSAQEATANLETLLSSAFIENEFGEEFNLSHWEFEFHGSVKTFDKAFDYFLWNFNEFTGYQNGNTQEDPTTAGYLKTLFAGFVEMYIQIDGESLYYLSVHARNGTNSGLIEINYNSFPERLAENTQKALEILGQ